MVSSKNYFHCTEDTTIKSYPVAQMTKDIK
jgi:hypothetical protein